MIDLKSISKNSSPKPPRIVVYGHQGIGKTTFAACSEKPIFILTEDGLGDIETPHFPLAKSYADVMEALESLLKDEHDYKTLVVDSLDWFESLVWAQTCSRLNIKSIEEAGYGRGYIECLTEWKYFLDYLNALRDEKGMTVILLAHGTIVKVEDPIHPSYDAHQLKLHKRAAAKIEEFSDILGFAAIKTLIKKEEGTFDKSRNRAITKGEHILHLSLTPGVAAKNRFHMPDELPLDYEVVREYLPGGPKYGTWKEEQPVEE